MKEPTAHLDAVGSVVEALAELALEPEGQDREQEEREEAVGGAGGVGERPCED